ncbi:MAG: calcium/proton exchanger [Candidatus Diapherotrites archaeon]|nr:calcium/proton exchanger [Candidatus Diapherotrites archaeon]
MVLKFNNLFLLLLVFIPISWFCQFFTGNSVLIFASVLMALIPLAYLIGHSTKEIALQTNSRFTGLINATFGNLIELIIAVLALSNGLIALVQASIVGSIIGNILLLIGLSVFFGGTRHKEQKFDSKSVGVSATMLIIAIAGLAIPTALSFTKATSLASNQTISLVVGAVLAVTYIAGLVFSFFTHKDFFDISDNIKAAKEKPTMSRKHALLVLFAATIMVAIESEFLVHSVQTVATTMGLTETFIGIVLISIVTNVAENASSIYFALQNKIDIAIEIGLNSAIQIALFVVPILVIISQIMNFGFTLVFSVFEIIAMFLAVMLINYLSSDGKCNWLEGIQLLAVYLIIITAFYFV